MEAVLIGKASFKDPDCIPASQLYPFFSYRATLRRELGLEFKHIHAHTFAEIERAYEGVKANVFFVRPAWQESPIEAERVMAKLRHKNPNAKIIFIDPFDQTSSRFFNVLPYVDRLLKYQRLKDVSTYTQPLVGGTLLTDRLTKELGYDLNNWHIGSEVPSGYDSRIDTGWYLSLIPTFKRALFRRPLPWQQFRKKDIDIFCHVSYGPRNNLEWYGQHRMAAIELLKPLASTYRLAISGEYSGERTVSTRQYFNEIKRSRIAFSPFGWGEITLRDYEAVCYGCLLIKPSVEHIDVEPNIFIPGETYVPVRWDYADLVEKCRYYLDHPDEADRIIHNAREAYKAYFTQNQFVRKIETLIHPIPVANPIGSDLLPKAVASPP